MTWLQTNGGQAFDLLAPDPGVVSIEEIAHALAHQCRYNGHVRHHYSVAEHCVLVSQWLEARHGVRQLAAGGLLHDAAEAYIGDLAAPVKLALPPPALDAWRAIEEGVEGAICSALGVGQAWLHDPRVKEADTRLLLDERAELMAPPPRPWPIARPPLGVRIEAYAPEEARRQFLKRWREVRP